MTRARSIALALAVVVATVMVLAVSPVPLALADGPPSGMSGISTDAIDSDLPPNTPMGAVAGDLEEHGVYTSGHADTLEVTVTNPGRAKQYTNGSVFGSGPIAIVFSDDAHSDGRDVALPTEVIEEIFGYLPKLARGTHEDGEQWASPIYYEDGYAVFEIPHFSDQVVTMEGEISLSSDSALTGDTFSYEIENGSSVDTLTFELTGVDHIESASTIQELANGGSFTHDVGGNQPSGTATLSLEGSTEIQQGTYSGTASSSDSFDLNATAGGELTEITLTGNEETRSESTSISGTSESITIGGTSSASNFDVQVQGSWDYSTYEGSYQSPSYSQTHYNCDMQAGDFADCPTDYSGDVSHLDDPKIHNLVVELTGSGTSVGLAIKQGGTYDVLVADTHTGGGSKTYTVGDYNLDSSSFEIIVEESSGNHDMYYTFDKIEGINEKTQGVSVSIDGQTKSLGNLNDGETASATFSSVSTGSQTLSVSTSSGSAYLTSTATWDEKYAVVNPTVSVGGEEVLNFEGTLLDGQTTTETLDTPIDLNEGTNTVTISQEADIDLGWEADVDEIWATENPSVDVDGINYNHTGVLEEGDSVSWDLGSGFEDNISVSNAQIDEGTVIVNLTVDEATRTEDPEITINGNHTVSYNGTLADGETVDFTSNASLDWVNEGENTISVSAVAPSVSGPAGKVGINWRHSGDSSKVVNHSGQLFSEVSTIEHTWVEDQSDATITVEWASTNVIRLGDLQVTHNGSEIPNPSYSFSGSDIIINVGEVDAGETTKIDLTGWKIAAENGDIEVTSPTDKGHDLVTTFEVTNTTAEALNLQVGGHEQGHLIHVLDEDSDAPDGWDVRILPDGSQEVRMPNVAVGDSIRIETSDLEVTAKSGDAVVNPIDLEADEPTFAVTYDQSEGDEIDVIWHGAESVEQYQLYSVTEDQVVDVKEANSPVSFTILNLPTTYKIQPYIPPGSDSPPPPPPAPIDQSTGLPGPLWMWLLGGVVASVIALGYAARRFGGTSSVSDVDVTIPVIDRGIDLTIPGLARSPILLGGLGLVGLITLEVLTPGALLSPETLPIRELLILLSGLGLATAIWILHSRTHVDIPDWLLYSMVAVVSLVTLELVMADGLVSTLSVELGIALESGEIAGVLLGIGILLALWQIDARTTESIPLPILIAAGGITVVYVLETIQPGVILGGLSEGFATVSPLFWLIVIVGGAYFARGYIKAQRAPDTQVQLQLEGNN